MSLFGRGVVAVLSPTGGAPAIVHASIARTPLARERGLQNVRRLPKSDGMLFIFPSEGPWSIWMRDTFIPLDVIFANKHGYIHTIVYGTQPLSDQKIVGSEPSRFILEVPAGQARRAGIRPGSLISLV